jgi:hypothetical protein
MPNRDPDPNCKDCKGTGKITLAVSVADCGCCAPAEGDDDALRELLDQLRGLGPRAVATSGGPIPPVFLDFGGAGEPAPRSGP